MEIWQDLPEVTFKLKLGVLHLDKKLGKDCF